MYKKKIIPFFLSVPCFFSIMYRQISTIIFSSDSYKNVGWKYSKFLYSIGLNAYGIYNFQGNEVGSPNASELKKFPHLPIICPVINPKENKSANLKKFSLCFFVYNSSISTVKPIYAEFWASC